MNSKLLLIMQVTAALITGCSTTVVRDTQPARTATEQLLISTAADHAAAKLNFDMPTGTRFFLDPQHFDSSMPDSKYAIGVIENRILRQGFRIASKRDEADKVVEISLGALSINEINNNYLGIPSFSAPIPFAGSLTIPEIDFIKKREQYGLAKIAATVYDVNDGSWQDTTGPVYGFSHWTRWKVFVLSWISSDLVPKEEQVSEDDND